MNPAIDPALFKQAMRRLAGGVAVITVGAGADRTGFTATSVTSLSADPPRLIVSLNRATSSWPVLNDYKSFGVNLLSSGQEPIADRFAGRGGEKGAARFFGSKWKTLVTGTPLLADALAAIDCTVEESSNGIRTPSSLAGLRRSISVRPMTRCFIGRQPIAGSLRWNPTARKQRSKGASVGRMITMVPQSFS